MKTNATQGQKLMDERQKLFQAIWSKVHGRQEKCLSNAMDWLKEATDLNKA